MYEPDKLIATKEEKVDFLTFSENVSQKENKVEKLCPFRIQTYYYKYHQ